MAEYKVEPSIELISLGHGVHNSKGAEVPHIIKPNVVNELFRQEDLLSMYNTYKNSSTFSLSKRMGWTEDDNLCVLFAAINYKILEEQYNSIDLTISIGVKFNLADIMTADENDCYMYDAFFMQHPYTGEKVSGLNTLTLTRNIKYTSTEQLEYFNGVGDTIIVPIHFHKDMFTKVLNVYKPMVSAGNTLIEIDSNGKGVNISDRVASDLYIPPTPVQVGVTAMTITNNIGTSIDTYTAVTGIAGDAVVVKSIDPTGVTSGETINISLPEILPTRVAKGVSSLTSAYLCNRPGKVLTTEVLAVDENDQATLKWIDIKEYDIAKNAVFDWKKTGIRISPYVVKYSNFPDIGADIVGDDTMDTVAFYKDMPINSGHPLYEYSTVTNSTLTVHDLDSIEFNPKHEHSVLSTDGTDGFGVRYSARDKAVLAAVTDGYYDLATYTDFIETIVVANPVLGMLDTVTLASGMEPLLEAYGVCPDNQSRYYVNLRYDADSKFYENGEIYAPIGEPSLLVYAKEALEKFYREKIPMYPIYTREVSASNASVQFYVGLGVGGIGLRESIFEDKSLYKSISFLKDANTSNEVQLVASKDEPNLWNKELTTLDSDSYEGVIYQVFNSQGFCSTDYDINLYDKDNQVTDDAIIEVYGLTTDNTDSAAVHDTGTLVVDPSGVVTGTGLFNNASYFKVLNNRDFGDNLAVIVDSPFVDYIGSRINASLLYGHIHATWNVQLLDKDFNVVAQNYGMIGSGEMYRLPFFNYKVPEHKYLKIADNTMEYSTKYFVEYGDYIDYSTYDDTDGLEIDVRIYSSDYTDFPRSAGDIGYRTTSFNTPIVHVKSNGYSGDWNTYTFKNNNSKNQKTYLGPITVVRPSSSWFSISGNELIGTLSDFEITYYLDINIPIGTPRFNVKIKTTPDEVLVNGGAIEVLSVLRNSNTYYDNGVEKPVDNGFATVTLDPSVKRIAVAKYKVAPFILADAIADGVTSLGTTEITYTDIPEYTYLGTKSLDISLNIGSEPFYKGFIAGYYQLFSTVLTVGPGTTEISPSAFTPVENEPNRSEFDVLNDGNLYFEWAKTNKEKFKVEDVIVMETTSEGYVLGYSDTITADDSAYDKPFAENIVVKNDGTSGKVIKVTVAARYIGD